MYNLFVALFLLSLVGLVIGLVRPEWIMMPSRKLAGRAFGAATAILFILVAVTTPSVQSTPTTAAQAITTSQAANTSNTPTSLDTGANSAPHAPTTVVPKKTAAVSAPQPAPVSVSTPAPAPAPTPAPAPATNSETISQQNAVKKAVSYLDYAAFSHDGLVAQLEYDQFSHADAVYGADNSGANWNEQAAKKAKSYMSYSAFSRGSLIAQLEYDQFTQAQAEYGANAVGL
ncbi:MAG: Ltp family lipoprotein [Minisyncoccota bacterium]